MSQEKQFREELKGIRNEKDFENILNTACVSFNGSRRRCAEELRSLSPKGGIVFIINRAIARLSKACDWNFAGD